MSSTLRRSAVGLVIVVLAAGMVGCAPRLQHTAALDELGIPKVSSLSRRTVFATSFESVDELAGHYITPQSDATRHELSRERVHGGQRAHKGWLTGVPPAVPEKDGPNHRGYPTIQLFRPPAKPCVTPCLIELWVWLDVVIPRGQWFSLATFTADPSSSWQPVVTVNVGAEGTLHTFHVPRPGLSERVFQTDERFPMRRWVRVTTYLDLSAHGAIATWQDGMLTSAARLETPQSGRTLQQAHFGLYAPPQMLDAVVYNDDLTIAELR